MAFQITEILDSKSDNVLARVLHRDKQLVAAIRGMEERPIPVGTPFQAEISFEDVRHWKVVDDFEDARSGIWQEQEGIHLLGRVHSILDYGDERIMVDVYIQNGPEFFAFTFNAAEDEMPDANDGLEIIVGRLYLDPTGA